MHQGCFMIEAVELFMNEILFNEFIEYDQKKEK